MGHSNRRERLKTLGLSALDARAPLDMSRDAYGQRAGSQGHKDAEEGAAIERAYEKSDALAR